MIKTFPLNNGRLKKGNSGYRSVLGSWKVASELRKLHSFPAATPRWGYHKQDRRYRWCFRGVSFSPFVCDALPLIWEKFFKIILIQHSHNSSALDNQGGYMLQYCHCLKVQFTKVIILLIVQHCAKCKIQKKPNYLDCTACFRLRLWENMLLCSGYATF